MKKIILLLASLFFVGCIKTVYVDKDTNEIIEIKELKGTDFINLQRVKTLQSICDVTDLVEFDE